MDWEKECKRLMYDVLPKMAVDNEHLEAAVKKLISERDQAIADIRLMFKEGECAICPHDEETCMVYDVECEWRGVKK